MRNKSHIFFPLSPHPQSSLTSTTQRHVCMPSPSSIVHIWDSRSKHTCMSRHLQASALPHPCLKLYTQQTSSRRVMYVRAPPNVSFQQHCHHRCGEESLKSHLPSACQSCCASKCLNSVSNMSNTRGESATILGYDNFSHTFPMNKNKSALIPESACARMLMCKSYVKHHICP